MLKDKLITWTKAYFASTGGKAIIGISGGKDSTIAAAVLVEAIGADRVIGVLMPNGEQKDISDSLEVCNLLGIDHYTINIGDAYKLLSKTIQDACEDALGIDVANHSVVSTNLPSRLRMSTLYTVAALMPGSRVVNTSNRSERWVGYSTKWGDGVGDVSLFGNLTVSEVLQIGDELGLPAHLVHKSPSDGMSGKTDEDNLGFTYAQLDEYLLNDNYNLSDETVSRIDFLHRINKHKVEPMPTFTKEDY